MLKVVALHFECVRPRRDIYYRGIGHALYEYCVLYVPQLRFKNRRCLITTTFDETACPYIEVFFHDGRSTIIDCVDTPLHEIKQHFEVNI